LAVEKGHIEIVKLLLEHGADVNIKDSNGVQRIKNNKFVRLISICDFILLELNITAQFVDCRKLHLTWQKEWVILKCLVSFVNGWKRKKTLIPTLDSTNSEIHNRNAFSILLKSSYFSENFV
jgi:hypothetical protein